MKLRIIRFCILSLSALLWFTACDESIDADKYNKVSKELLPSLITDADSVSFDRVKLQSDIELNGDENIMESGFFVCSDNFFPDSLNRIIMVDHDDLTLSLWVDKLVGSTEYFYKAYTFSENGFAFSAVNSIVTAEPPVFEDTYLFGSYNEIDYSIKYGIVDFEKWGYWDELGYITIKQVENTYNQIEVYNFWGYGRTIIGVVDFENKEIKFSPQEISAHPDQGPILMYRWSMLNDQMKIHLEDSVTATYDENGTIKVAMWGGFTYYDGGYWVIDACSKTELIKKEL